MFEAFLQLTQIDVHDTIIDVGATSDRDYDHSNYLEAWYPHKGRVTAVGIDDAGFLRDQYPGTRVVQADGRALPFKDAAFDFGHSSAVLEHVGTRDSQAQFLRELWRVSRKGIFVTTPNRWFPIEFHTVLPLVHWLPIPLYRRILTAIGKDFFASEKNLNLMSKSDLATAARIAGIEPRKLRSVSLLGWPTNLLLVARKAV